LGEALIMFRRYCRQYNNMADLFCRVRDGRVLTLKSERVAAAWPTTVT
jgi:hypothetical protein